MLRRSVGTLALLALLLPMAASQGAEPVERRDQGMRWFTDLDAAIQEAKDRNIPLYVGLHKDH
jgi:hypothetical protein